MSGLELASWITVGAPLAGTVALAAAGNRIAPRAAAWLGSLAILVGFGGALGALLAWNAGNGKGKLFTAYQWLSGGTFDVGVDLWIDPVSIFMMLIVTGVGFLIHVYSIGYMHGDEQKRRFFAYLNVFVFAMLVLVMAGNLVMLLVGWGLVGMASYLLIGYWHHKPSAVAAAKKAFIMNAVGDVAIMLGLFLIFSKTLALSYPAVFNAWPEAVEEGSAAALMAALLMLGGAAAKSAQLPLHTWLPDAMEGPTPVSALIHAATMVTAGVYLVARMWPIFDQSEAAQIVVAMMGAIGLIFAGFVALVQTDIKRVIAYSTMSQIAYMFVAVGIGAYSAGLFHLMTHAFFKALLFLGAGIVIHAVADEQDIRRMGGLKKYLPKTYALFVIASLALVGIIPLSGFWSKDEILAFAFASNELYGAWGWAVWVLGLAGVLMTGLYSFRLVFLVFHGPEGQATKALAAHPHEQEAPATMLVPVAILGVLAAVAGLLVIPGAWNVVGDFLHGASHGEVFLGGSPTREALHEAEPSTALIWLLSGVSLALGLIGIAIARAIWLRDGTPHAARTRFPRGERVLHAGFGWDAAYDRGLFRPAAGLSRFVRSGVERAVIEPAMWLIAGGTRGAGTGVGALQTGLVRSYAVGTILAAAAIVVAVLVLR